MLQIHSAAVSAFTIHKNQDSAPLREPTSYAGFRICVVLQGTAVWEINGHHYPIVPGDVILLNHHQKRRFIQYGPNGLTLGGLNLDRLVLGNTDHYSFYMACVRDMDGVFHSQPLWNILVEAHRECLALEHGYLELLSAKLTEFFIKAERLHHFIPENSPKPDQEMLRILDYIDSGIADKICLSDAAQLAGMTESSFSRWFSHYNGISFKKYVMSKRIASAIILLETSDRTVTDIAYSCGFDSISGFYDAFRKITGTTPGKYSGVI